MGRQVKIFKVNSLNKVDTTKYIEGSLFITNKSVGVLINGTIKTLSTSTPSLKNYVKKSEVEKMIKDYIGGGE